MPNAPNFGDGTEMISILVRPEAARTGIHLLVRAALAAVLFALGGTAHAQQPPSPGVPQSTRVRVEAGASWVPTPVELLALDWVELIAEGRWSNGGESPQFTGPRGFTDPVLLLPETLLPSAPLGSLIGRISDETFAVGESVQFTVRQAGRLHLAMNDDPRFYQDNTGYMMVAIRWTFDPTRMPDLTGKPFEDANRILRERFHQIASPKAGHSKLAAGLVFDQAPAPGEVLGPASTIVLSVSDGEPTPSPILVPKVAGTPQAQAIESLAKNDLRATAGGEESSPFERGRVTRTDPEAFTPVAPGAIVTYWLASGENVVPHLEGEPESQAEDILRNAGFRLGAITRREVVEEPGHVLDSDPPAGAIALLGSEVGLTIGDSPVSPPPTVLVPALAGTPQAQAIDSLAKKDLRATSGGEEPSPFERGLVTRTEPKAFTPVTRDSIVTYWLASGENLVPRLVGASLSTAEDVLKAAGFRRGAVAYRTTVRDFDHVVASQPSAGRMAQSGSAVDLTIGRSLSYLVLILLAGAATLGGGAVAAHHWLWPPTVKATIEADISQPTWSDAVPEAFPEVSLSARLVPGEVVTQVSVPILKEV